MSWRRWTTPPVSGSTKIVTIDQTPGLGSGGEGDEVVVPFLEDRGGREKKPRGGGGERRKTGKGRRSAVQWRGRSTARKDAAGFVGDHTKNKGARYVNGLRVFPYFLLLGLLSPAAHPRSLLPRTRVVLRENTGSAPDGKQRLSCVGGFTKPQRCGPIKNPSLQR
jgi:hypothetical protein